MDEKCEKTLTDQRKALSHFLSLLSASSSPDKLVNAFKLFLLCDGKVQKLQNQLIEHQRVSQEIQELTGELSLVNGEIKGYVEGVSAIDANLSKLMADSSIYDNAAKQMFKVEELMQCAFHLRDGTAVKQINLSKNEAIKAQMPIAYPVPQALTASKSILRLSTAQLGNDFLTSRIKDEANKIGGGDKDADDDSDNSEDNSELEEEDDAGLEGFF